MQLRWTQGLQHFLRINQCINLGSALPCSMTMQARISFMLTCVVTKRLARISHDALQPMYDKHA